MMRWSCGELLCLLVLTAIVVGCVVVIVLHAVVSH